MPRGDKSAKPTRRSPRLSPSTRVAAPTRCPRTRRGGAPGLRSARTMVAARSPDRAARTTS